MVKRLYPKNLILLHGEVNKMFKLKDFIQENMQIPTFVPPNNTTLKFDVRSKQKCYISSLLSTKFDKVLRNEDTFQFKGIAAKSNEKHVIRLVL